MIPQAAILAKLKKSRSAESLAIALGYEPRDCRWLVPALYELKAEGKVRWEVASERGLIHWRRA